MGVALAALDATADPIDLALAMGQVCIERGKHRLGQAAADVQHGVGAAYPCEELRGQRHVVAIALFLTIFRHEFLKFTHRDTDYSCHIAANIRVF